MPQLGVILHVSDYKQPYAGNFIASLQGLAIAVGHQAGSCAFVFPSSAATQPWYAQFAQHHRVFLIPVGVRDSRRALLQILLSLRPTIVHSHFDTFDVPLSLAYRDYRRRTQCSIRQVWHLHNQKGYSQHGIRWVYWRLRFLVHYGFFSRDVSVISVSHEMQRFISRYHRLVWHADIASIRVIPNGIDFSRCGQRTDFEPHRPFVFLAFGRSYLQKRTDLLLAAAQQLIDRGYHLRVIVTRGEDDQRLLAAAHLHDQAPQWLRFIDPAADIHQLFQQADCFVSTSIHETFSYAVCEATGYGLPVIQSDIEGTLWNSGNPSTYLFRSQDIDHLAAQMQQVMQASPAQMQRQCLATRQINRSHYPLARWCQDVMQFYSSVIHTT